MHPFLSNPVLSWSPYPGTHAFYPFYHTMSNPEFVHQWARREMGRGARPLRDLNKVSQAARRDAIRGDPGIAGTQGHLFSSRCPSETDSEMHARRTGHSNFAGKVFGMMRMLWSVSV